MDCTKVLQGDNFIPEEYFHINLAISIGVIRWSLDCLTSMMRTVVRRSHIFILI